MDYIPPKSVNARYAETLSALRALGFEVGDTLLVLVGGVETPVEAILDLGLPFWIDKPWSHDGLA